MTRSGIALAISVLIITSAHSALAQYEDSLPDAYRVIELTNRQRAQQGLPPLKAEAHLIASAFAHAKDMADNHYFSHTSRTGSAPWDRARLAGYSGCRAENIYAADGSATPQSAVDAWMRSRGHRAAILDPTYREIGVGFAKTEGGDGASNWVQTFGYRDDVYPVVINNEAWSTDRASVDLYIYGEGKATQMCLSNTGKLYGAWEPFQSHRRWDLEAGAGLRTVYVAIKDDHGHVYLANDSIVVTDPSDADAAPAQHVEPVALAAPSSRGKLPGLPGLGMAQAPGETPAGPGEITTQRPAVRMTASGEVVVPMIFPVVGKVSWSNTFGAPRDGGRRRHEGQDLMAPKMRPLVAAFDGIVHFDRTNRANVHNMLCLQGDNGWSAMYMHINNDTPGTNDGVGSWDYAFAPGLQSGDHVVAGQHIAYVGNSGNAEHTAPHLHFELHGEAGVVNAAASLRAARHLAAPIVDVANRARTKQVALSVLNPFTTTRIVPASVHNTIVGHRPSHEMVADCMIAPSSVVQPPVRRAPRPMAQVTVYAPAPQNNSASGTTPAEQVTSRKVRLRLAPARVVVVVNEYRARYDLPQVVVDEALCRAAERQCQDMVQNGVRCHIGSDGSDADGRVNAAGFDASAVSEFLADAGSDPVDVVDSWMEHGWAARRALLGKAYTHIGFAYIETPDGGAGHPAKQYRVVVLAARRNAQ